MTWNWRSMTVRIHRIQRNAWYAAIYFGSSSIVASHSPLIGGSVPSTTILKIQRNGSSRYTTIQIGRGTRSTRNG